MSAEASESRSILVVDDDPAIRTLLCHIFESEKYQVTTAVNAADGCAKIREGDFDLVVTDMRMETAVAGYEVVREARRHLKAPIAVVLTAYPIEEADWRSEGAHAALRKPVPVAELLNTVRGLMRGGGADRQL